MQRPRVSRAFAAYVLSKRWIIGLVNGAPKIKIELKKHIVIQKG
jgi:hypothetical protein